MIRPSSLGEHDSIDPARARRLGGRSLEGPLECRFHASFRVLWPFQHPRCMRALQWAAKLTLGQQRPWFTARCVTFLRGRSAGSDSVLSPAESRFTVAASGRPRSAAGQVRGNRPLQRGHERVDIAVGVRGREESDLEGARCEVDAARQQRMVYRARSAARSRPEAPPDCAAVGSAAPAAPPPGRARRSSRPAALQSGQRRQRLTRAARRVPRAVRTRCRRRAAAASPARRTWPRVGAQRAGLVHRPGRRDQLHQVAPAAVGAHRKAAADDLAVGDEVRRRCRTGRA